VNDDILPGQYPLFGGLPPHQKKSRTSREAAIRAEKNVRTVLHRVLLFYQSQGRVGATNDEVSFSLGIPIQTICARKRELEIQGFIVPANRTRKTRCGRLAEVYIAKENL